MSSMYKGYRFPREIISHCVWLYHRFTLSLREIELMMAARGIEVFLRDDPHLMHPVRARVRPPAATESIPRW
ncbi:hypothetical protein R3Q06_35065 [Rhodococcus erythropolis]|uniref:hypothetical protein n=1 Tax=Rhodococcus erythropolis TaxID=1833 RepID=UPI002949E20F|nr:hypothetical protein [Rhodococcus erythropolis]MDV6278611.1 hypothetical protein [Rhodococcus erythropolis]